MDVDCFLRKVDFHQLFINSQWPWQITHFILRNECFGCHNQTNPNLPLHFIISEEKIKYLLFTPETDSLDEPPSTLKDHILTLTKNIPKAHQEGSVSQEPQEVIISQEPQIASLVEGSQEFSIEGIHINDSLIIGDASLTIKVDSLITKVNTIQENQAILQANINIILENQTLCYEAQQLMMLHLSHTVTQFEEYLNKSSQSTKKTENVNFQLIQNYDQLRRLESLLENSEKELEIKKKLSTICGKGKGRGINNAYALIDAIFDRTFLKTCSWAGGSRSTETKVCFKSFTKVIKLFFDIVYGSNNCFKLNECHNFLKNVLKNSSQRCKSKNLRTSTTKHRPKKKTNVNTNHTEVLEEKDNLNDKVPSEPDKPIERTPSEMDKQNKITTSGCQGPNSNLRMPLKELNLITVEAEVYV